MKRQQFLVTNSDFYVKKETCRKKQGKILEGNRVVFDHGLIAMLEGAWSAFSKCAGSYKNPRAEGTRSKAWLMLWGETMCKPEQMGVELQSKHRPHFSKEKQSDSLQPSCRDSRKAFPRATWYNLWPRGPLKFCSYHKTEAFSLIVFLRVMFKSYHMLLL